MHSKAASSLNSYCGYEHGLNCFGEDYCLNTPEWAVSESSGLDKWREEEDEIFDLLDEKADMDGMDSQLKGNSHRTTQGPYKHSLYNVTHHSDELYAWENAGKEEKAGAYQDGMVTQAGNTNKNTDPTTDTSSESDKKLDQTAIVADMCLKWGPDRFDRWCEEYATPISETIWNEASTDLDEFSGVQSEPAPAQSQEEDRVVLAPRRHSFQCPDPPRRYLRTRRSMQST